jgi:hypothetical protein
MATPKKGLELHCSTHKWGGWRAFFCWLPLYQDGETPNATCSKAKFCDKKVQYITAGQEPLGLFFSTIYHVGNAYFSRFPEQTPSQTLCARESLSDRAVGCSSGEAATKHFAQTSWQRQQLDDQRQAHWDMLALVIVSAIVTSYDVQFIYFLPKKDFIFPPLPAAFPLAFPVPEELLGWLFGFGCDAGSDSQTASSLVTR